MKKIPMILDTDTYNEIDDQFAVVYAALANDKLDMRGFTAVPFLCDRSKSAQDGMIKSYREILFLLDTLKIGNLPVHLGSEEFMIDPETPVESEAADFIISEARRIWMSGEKLTVTCIGAATNIASALILCPELKNMINIIWLGGNEIDYKDNNEFNVMQDPNAAKALFAHAGQFTQVPCMSVASKLDITLKTLSAYLEGCGELGKYLTKIFADYTNKYDYTENKVIWDIAAVACSVCPEAVESTSTKRPHIGEKNAWDFSQEHGNMEVITKLNTKMIFDDIFGRIQKYCRK